MTITWFNEKLLLNNIHPFSKNLILFERCLEMFERSSRDSISLYKILSSVIFAQDWPPEHVARVLLPHSKHTHNMSGLLDIEDYTL